MPGRGYFNVAVGDTRIMGAEATGASGECGTVVVEFVAVEVHSCGSQSVPRIKCYWGEICAEVTCEPLFPPW